MNTEAKKGLWRAAIRELLRTAVIFLILAWQANDLSDFSEVKNALTYLFVGGGLKGLEVLKRFSKVASS